MEINGLQIRDIKDIQDALTAFATLNAELENLSDSMAQNLGDYKSLTTNQKEVLNAINQLQINSTSARDKIIELLKELPKYLDDMKSSFKSDANSIDAQIKATLSSFEQNMQSSLLELNRKLKELDRENQESIKTAINSINYKQVQKHINQTVKQAEYKLINSLDNFTKVIRAIKETKREIESVSYELNDSVESFNSAVKSMNWVKSIAYISIGAVIGAAAMLYFGLQEAKPLYYADIVQKQKEYETAKAKYLKTVKNLTGVAKFLNKNGIIFGYGYFDDTKEPYIYFKKGNYTNAWKDKAGDFVISLKK